MVVMKRFMYLLVVAALLTACAPKNDVETKAEQEKATAADVHVPVSVKKMKPERFEHFFTANGIVEALNAAFISPEMNGQVKHVYVEEGHRVSAGQVLAELNTAITRNTMEELKTRYELAEIAFNKQKELWDQKIGSEMQFLQAKNAKETLEKSMATLETQLDMAKMKAPFSGIIDDIFIKEGEMAAPGMQVMQLVNLSKLVINADISESYISRIKKGDTVHVSFPAYPDIEMQVPVYRTGNVINPNNRTFNVQLHTNNIEEKLKPNIMASLRIKDFELDSAFVVPSIIVKQDLSKGHFVFRAVEKNGETVAEKTFVKTGISYQDKTVIEKGLSAGDKVIVNGYNMVSTGTVVKIK